MTLWLDRVWKWGGCVGVENESDNIRTEILTTSQIGSPPQSTHRVALANSGVYSIMIVKSAQPGGGRGVRDPPPPFHSIYHHEQSCGVRSSREGRNTPHISPLPFYVLCGLHRNLRYIPIKCHFSLILSGLPLYIKTNFCVEKKDYFLTVCPMNSGQGTDLWNFIQNTVSVSWPCLQAKNLLTESVKNG